MVCERVGAVRVGAERNGLSRSTRRSVCSPSDADQSSERLRLEAVLAVIRPTVWGVVDALDALAMDE
jgi:hypothetical protein